MSTTRRFGTWMAAALVSVAVGAAAAAAAEQAQDRVYASAALESHRGMTVAILPAVAVADDPAVERRVEASWVALYAGATTRWMPANEVRARVARASREAGLESRIEREVWRSGAVEPQTAARLARLLGVDAVLSLRVSRWEISDGSRAMVEIGAVLQDQAGSTLWSVAGLSSYGQPIPSRDRNFNAELTWFRSAAIEPARQDARNLDRALLRLLGRWAWVLPEGPIFQDGASEPSLVALDPKN